MIYLADISYAALSEDVERTTTAEALLGMLSLGPMSGYEIRQPIEESIGNFWRESFGQIYPTLKRLVAGWAGGGGVEERGARVTGRRKVYRADGGGLEAAGELAEDAFR